MGTDYINSNINEAGNAQKYPGSDPSVSQHNPTQELAKKGNANVQNERPEDVLNTDSISQSELPANQQISYYTKDGKVYAEITIRNLGAPELPPPNTAANTEEQLPVANHWFSASNYLSSLFDAFNAMMRSQQNMKRSDKMTELAWAEMSLEMSKDSARLTIELGKLEQMEHIYKALVQVAVGIASAGAAIAMPKAQNVGGASFIAGSELVKGVANAFGELVGAAFAVPKATVQAQKQIKDAINQLLIANKEHAAQAAKEAQDEENRIIQMLGEILQKFKEAVKLVQG